MVKLTTVSVRLDDRDKRDLDTLYEKLYQAEKERSEGRMLDGPSVMAELLLKTISSATNHKTLEKSQRRKR